MGFTDRLLRRATGPLATGVLAAAATAFNLDLALRRTLYRRHDGVLQPQDGRWTLRLADGSWQAHVAVEDGRVRVDGDGEAEADATLTFRDEAVLRRFLWPVDAPDLQSLAAEGRLSWEGSASKVARLGYLVASLRTRGRRAAPEGPAGADARATLGASLLESSRADRRPPRIPLPPIPGSALDDPALARWSLDDFPRLRALRAEHFGSVPEVCSERARLVTEHFRRSGFETDPAGQPRNPLRRQGEALKYVLERKQPVLAAWGLLAGTTTARPTGIPVYPEFAGTDLWPELASPPPGRWRVSTTDAQVLAEEVFPFWADRNVRDHVRRTQSAPASQRLEEKRAFVVAGQASSLSHVVPDWAVVLERGLLALQGDAERSIASTTDEARRDFWRSVQDGIDGVLRFSERLADQAELLTDDLNPGDADDMERMDELLELARICRKVPARPAETLHEALQAMWTVLVALAQENADRGISLGRLDRLLQPFLDRDLARAKTPVERDACVRRAVELVGSFFLQCNDHRPVASEADWRQRGGRAPDIALTVGGVDADGRDAVCDMTWIVLKVTEMLAIRDPNVNARYDSAANPPEFLRRVCDVNAVTGATPTIHNDRAVVEALVRQGIPAADARNWAATGTVEPTVAGRQFGNTDAVVVNGAAALELALHDGFHPGTGEQIGPRTGRDPLALDPPGNGQRDTGKGRVEVFDRLVAAYKEQLGFLIDQGLDYDRMLGEAHRQLHPTPLLSALVDGCLEAGRDATEGGARFDTSGVSVVGLPDAVDGLIAVRRLVVDEKVVRFPMLLRALRDDFAGHDALAARARTKVPRFGSGDAETQELLRELMAFVSERLRGRTNARGGSYLPGFWSRSEHVAFGLRTGALPDGRGRGRPLAPGLTPRGDGTGDLTEQIRDVAALEPARMPNGTAFCVKLSPAPGEPHERVVDCASAYARTLFDLGGMQVQYNVVSSAMLKDAMDHPESYRNLMVRVSGYNAYFVELSAPMQLELVERMEHR